MAALGIMAKRSDLAIVGAAMRRDEEMHFMNIGYKAADLQTTISFKGKKAKEAVAYFISERSKYIKEGHQSKGGENNQPPFLDDPIEKIKKLNELKEAGILSQEEFEEKKRELLSKV